MLDAAAVGGLHRMMPGLQSGTFYARKEDEGFGQGVPVDAAEKRPTSQRMLQTGVIGLDEETCNWMLWKEKLAGGTVEPRRGDKWVDSAGVTWHVRRVDADLLGQRFRCLCVRGGEEVRPGNG